jgi:hypothetical protein
MIMAVQGSRNFEDYAVFLRAMRTALSTMKNEDKEIYIYSAGPAKINAMALEFSNVSERSLKARGIKIQMRKVPPSWVQEYMSELDYFAFFAQPGEPVSKLVDAADSSGVDAGVYIYS